MFLNGTAEQFATHTSRMLELEQEYLRRYPKRTWQGSGGAAEPTDIDVLRTALRGVVAQLEALLDRGDDDSGDSPPPVTQDPVVALLSRIADAPGGRMHKLEVHQLAREVGLERAALAKLYTAAPQLLVTEHEDRVLTAAGREHLGSH